MKILYMTIELRDTAKKRYEFITNAMTEEEVGSNNPETLVHCWATGINQILDFNSYSTFCEWITIDEKNTIQKEELIAKLRETKSLINKYTKDEFKLNTTLSYYR